MCVVCVRVCVSWSPCARARGFIACLMRRLLIRAAYGATARLIGVVGKLALRIAVSWLGRCISERRSVVSLSRELSTHDYEAGKREGREGSKTIAYMGGGGGSRTAGSRRARGMEPGEGEGVIRMQRGQAVEGEG